MRVLVREIDEGHASTPDAGLRLYALIEPVLARGEPVMLDFDGVKRCSTAFFSASVAILIEADKEDRLPHLLRYENLAPRWQPALELASDFALRCRQHPEAAAACDEWAKKLFARD